MSQVWQDGIVVPVTIVSVSPNTVSLVRTKEKDGYFAIQLKDGKKAREFRVAEKDKTQWSVGGIVDAGSFQSGDKVDVSSVSKGKGFQGVVKRHGFHGGPNTHGQKNRLRAPGSIGSTAPQRVMKGRRMAGHMGNDRVTVKGLTIAVADAEKRVLMIKGAIPGARGALIKVRKVVSASQE